MIIYGIKTCDTCRKARKALPDFDFVDVREDGMSLDLLQQAFELHGAALVNVRSTTWRGLDEAERARPPLDLLQDHPTLMKRPLILVGDQSYLGWTKPTQAALGVS